MTMDERVEAAARAAYADKGSYGDERLAWDAAASIIGEDEARAAHETFRSMARAAIAAAFPELHGDQPKGWIAPWEATEEMNDAVDDARDRYDHEFITSSRAFQVARDAYLGKGDGG